MVALAMLTRGWYKKCCMLAVLEHMPWAILSVLLGRDVNILIKLHGDIHINAPLWARTYVP